jgi:hypothetical protein
MKYCKLCATYLPFWACTAIHFTGVIDSLTNYTCKMYCSTIHFTGVKCIVVQAQGGKSILYCFYSCFSRSGANVIKNLSVIYGLLH